MSSASYQKVHDVNNLITGNIKFDCLVKALSTIFFPSVIGEDTLRLLLLF